MKVKSAFDAIPQAYDRYRPRYCPELFAQLEKTAQLGPDKSILEIGPGTGQATSPLLATGCRYLAIELVEQGKVDLDTPIVEYLPDFKMLDERYRQITLRHCLNHTSGLPGTQWKHFSTADVSENHYYEEVYDYMAHSYLKAAPGEYSTYCNDGFTLAEMVVAQVSGQSYAEYCMEHITEPIGAHSSRLSPVRNTDYPLVKEGKKPGELLLIQGGAGYTTTMMDLCKFGQQFLGDSKILSQKSKEEMSKRQGATFLEEDIRSTAFGLGWDSVCYSDPDYDLG